MEKAISGFNGVYLVTDAGGIISLKSGSPRQMATFKRSRTGHTGVNLTLNGKYKMHSVSRLVAEAFIGLPPFSGAVVMHLDDNPENNAATNLKWGSPAENSFDMVCKGRQAKGSKCGNSKLTESKVARIKQLFGELAGNQIAKVFGVSSTTISDIKSGRIWGHVVATQ